MYKAMGKYTGKKQSVGTLPEAQVNLLNTDFK